MEKSIDELLSGEEPLIEEEAVEVEEQLRLALGRLFIDEGVAGGVVAVVVDPDARFSGGAGGRGTKIGRAHV